MHKKSKLYQGRDRARFKTRDKTQEPELIYLLEHLESCLSARHAPSPSAGPPLSAGLQCRRSNLPCTRSRRCAWWPLQRIGMLPLLLLLPCCLLSTPFARPFSPLLIRQKGTDDLGLGRALPLLLLRHILLLESCPLAAASSSDVFFFYHRAWSLREELELPCTRFRGLWRGSALPRRFRATALHSGLRPRSRTCTGIAWGVTSGVSILALWLMRKKCCFYACCGLCKESTWVK